MCCKIIYKLVMSVYTDHELHIYEMQPVVIYISDLHHYLVHPRIKFYLYMYMCVSVKVLFTLCTHVCV